MQQHLLIPQHFDHEESGLLLQLQEEHSIPVDIVNLAQDSISKSSAVVTLGGPRLTIPIEP
ncbi:hypothetical protein CR161_08650 [Prosthecochloris sp. ZM]|uniref:hypothetical protein n=1 Tax=Prosthecochloris sp. ZM TaxID=2283143 RepID=UPI000DF72D80|nr:hypothetical protein [Prosthecochloris sp. ZM]RDD30767.1 hypothetical protein CR161_08650 [Prosthecochloris sp. ZM]